MDWLDSDEFDRLLGVYSWAVNAPEQTKAKDAIKAYICEQILADAVSCHSAAYLFAAEPLGTA